MLLVTILLANTTINVGYFVVTSVLLMHSDLGPMGVTLLATGFLFAIVLCGEVLPKALADAHRERLAPLLAPPLLTFQTIIGPVRIVLAHGVIAPLARLFAPHDERDDAVDDRDLRSLLDLSGAEGVIDDEEHRLLAELLDLKRHRVRDVMVPRVRMIALAADATRDEVRRTVEAQRQLTFPVYRESLDDIIGVLHVKRYLMDDSIESIDDPRVLSEARYVPELASLDQLLDRFRTWRTRAAVVVDEYGGTEGTVSVEDVVEEIVGDIVVGHPDDRPPVRLIGLATWEVAGDWSIHDFGEAFGLTFDQPPYSTVAGWVVDQLGFVPEEGETFKTDSMTVTVVSVVEQRIEAIELTQHDAPASDGASATSDGNGSGNGNGNGNGRGGSR